MKNFKKNLLVLAVANILMFTSTYANAGVELVCKGRQARSNHRVILVDCSKRKEFVDTLGAAWRKLNQEHIGQFDNMCWEAYVQAKEMPPTISFADVSDSFLIRCNMGLAYVD